MCIDLIFVLWVHRFLLFFLPIFIASDAVLGVLCACLLYFVLALVQCKLSMFDMERHSRNK